MRKSGSAYRTYFYFYTLLNILPAFKLTEGFTEKISIVNSFFISAYFIVQIFIIFDILNSIKILQAQHSNPPITGDCCVCAVNTAMLSKIINDL